MKKQLLIAAVAASMTSAAIADISITGAAKVNITDGVTKVEGDLSVVGKSGATSVVTNISLDSAHNEYSTTDTTPATTVKRIVEDVYATTSIAGINVKAGSYRSGKSELDKTSAPKARYELSTNVGPAKVAFEDNGNTTAVTVAADISGVALKHKVSGADHDSSETWVSGSFAGVNLSWNKENPNGDNNDHIAWSVDTDVNGIGLKYVKIDSDTTTDTDGYVTKDNIAEGSAIGISASVAGNAVTFKKIKTKATQNAADVDTNKIIVTRSIAGATVEGTYTDNEGDSDSLDLEIAVKF